MNQFEALVVDFGLSVTWQAIRVTLREKKGGQPSDDEAWRWVGWEAGVL